MKKLAFTLCLSALASAAFAQGTVNFLNSPSTLIRTNSSGLSTGSTGATSTAANGYFYALYTAPSTVTSASLSDLSGWTFAGLYGANTAATTGGRFTGGAAAATASGTWGPGVTNSFMIVGWSAGFAGQTEASVRSRMNGATFSNGQWSGGGLSGADNGQFVGISGVGFGAAGGGPNGIPAFSLFGAPNSQGTPLSSGFDLFVVNVPEPSTIALAGLGAAALVIFRRRKA